MYINRKTSERITDKEMQHKMKQYGYYKNKYTEEITCDGETYKHIQSRIYN